MVLFAAACATILCLGLFGTSEAAQDPLVNCNEVSDVDRCACNERILLALSQMRRIVPDPTQFGSAAEANTAIIIQQHQEHRLRTFYTPYAPVCVPPSSPHPLPTKIVKADKPSDIPLPIPEQHTGGWIDLKTVEGFLKPLRTRIIDDPSHPDFPDKPSDIDPYRLLIGRWDGWQTLADGKPSRVSLHVISLDQFERWVKACSDQGMVFLRRKGGYLEWPRVDSFGLAYSIRLWRSTPPRSQDLEGVALLDVRPGEVVVAGLVRLSRTLTFDWSTSPSTYFCQDRDLEEQRKEAREEQEREREKKTGGLLIELKEQIQQLQRELEEVRRRGP